MNDFIKKIILLCILIQLIGTGLTQSTIEENKKQHNCMINFEIPPEIEWNRTFGGTLRDSGGVGYQLDDQGYIALGYTESYSVGDKDIWLIKTNREGYEEWNRTYGGSDDDRGSSVVQTTDEGYMIFGQTKSFGNGYNDAWVIKTDENGNEQWNKTYGGSNNDICVSAQSTNDAGFIFCGATKSYGAGENENVWLMKIDADGNEVWNKTYGGLSMDWGICVQQTTDNGFIITGWTLSFHPSITLWLIKVDMDGVEQWNVTLGKEWSSDTGNHVLQTDDNGYIITGGTTAYGAGDYDVWLIKTDENGIELWNKTYGGTDDDRGNSVTKTADNGFIIGGHTMSYGMGSRDAWVIKTDSFGVIEWNATFGGADYDSCGFVEQTLDKGYIIFGSTSSFGAGDTDAWLIKLKGEDNPPAVSILNPKTGYFHICGVPIIKTRFDFLADTLTFGGCRFRPVLINITDDIDNCEDLKVQVYLNGEMQGNASYCNDWECHEWFWTGLSFGMYNLTIKATDKNGNCCSAGMFISNFCFIP